VIRLSFFPVSSNKINQFFQSHLFLVGKLLFYLVVAYNSSGYNQEDEHYQIIEFANYKLGLIPENRLAWEFAAHIRPGLQPLICFVFIKIFHALGINDGYDSAFLLRAVTAVFSIFVIKNFIKAHRHLVTEAMFAYFILISYLLWFLPYINVRFSSETWSGLFFLMALSFIQNQRKNDTIKKYLTTGLILGLSILFRYQSGLLVCGVTLWLLFTGSASARNFVAFLFSIVIVLCLGIAIDWWLYGEIVFSLYNYFQINLVEGVASSFGVSPWYEYVRFIFYGPGPFGIVILISFFITLYWEPKNLMLWAVIPFLLVHSMIPHKELRFLFPIANLVPLFLILSAQRIRGLWIIARGRYFLNSLLILALVINIAGLYAVAVTGAGTCRTVVAEFIHRNYPEKNTNIILIGDVYPYMDWGPPKNSFYSSSGLSITHVGTIWERDFVRHKRAQVGNIVVMLESDISGPEAIRFMKRIGLVRVYENIPDHIKLIYSLYDPSLNERAIVVYEFM
jgi:phosphatidylinositol glycan class B